MRKIKKINGYLVVKFNDRELREWADTALGNYGVIDAELYTGSLDIDRSVMEYDGAETLDEAIEQARSLDAEEDLTNEEPAYTIVTETDEATHEEEIEPQLMIAAFCHRLKTEVETARHKDDVARTAAHVLYGYKAALNELGVLEEEDTFVNPSIFGAASQQRDSFVHLEDIFVDFGIIQKKVVLAVVQLGEQLETDCPNDDCRVYLNIFHMAQELDVALDTATGFATSVLQMELRRQLAALRQMYLENHAVQKYKEWLRKKEPPVEGATPCEEGLFPTKGEARKVTIQGVKLLGEFYTNQRLLNYVGATVFVQKNGASYEAITRSGESLGAIAPHRVGGKEPPVEGATPCGKCPLQDKGEELKAVGKLLKEVEDYTNGGSRDRTSQSQE